MVYEDRTETEGRGLGHNPALVCAGCDQTLWASASSPMRQEVIKGRWRQSVW